MCAWAEWINSGNVFFSFRKQNASLGALREWIAAILLMAPNFPSSQFFTTTKTPQNLPEKTNLPSLKLTNCVHENRPFKAPKGNEKVFQPSIFRGLTHWLRFREGNHHAPLRSLAFQEPWIMSSRPRAANLAANMV